MTDRTFDVHIRIKPNSLIQSLHSSRTYTASDELRVFDFMAVLERDNYVFSTGIVQYAVSPDDVEIIDYD
tara:strand:+ start:1648 stop:1857 length:210 start_codon:yes stop_codon:yes gene_type:complete